MGKYRPSAYRNCLFALLAAIAACGGGGSAGDGSGGPSSGSLAVSVSGLPAGLDGAVVVSGPGGFSQNVLATQTGGCSITGGRVYRGSAIPELRGRYFYSDFCSGWLRSFVYRNGAAAEEVDWNITNVGQIYSFGADAQNELYVLASTGKAYRIVRQ